MFGRTGNEVFHCFTAEIPSSVCRAEWLPEEMWKPCTWLWYFHVQTGDGFKECLCSSGSLFLKLGVLPPGHILKVPCQFLDACSHGLSQVPSQQPFPQPTVMQSAQEALLAHFIMHTHSCVSSEWKGGRVQMPSLAVLKPKAKRKKNTDVGSLKTWYLVHHEFFLHFYFKVLH